MKKADINTNEVYNIAPGMTTEEITALFFDSNALVEQPERVYRLESDLDRYYYTFDEKGEPTFYVSVTTMIKQTLRQSPHLIKWIASKGYEESKEIAQERADYGTFLHKEIAILLIERRLDLDAVELHLREYIEENELPYGFKAHEHEIKRDLIAFAQFMKDYKIQPLAVEIVLTHSDGYAGTLDLPCKMTIQVDGFDYDNPYKSGPRKGDPREIKEDLEIVAIIDFKSGRKGFLSCPSC